VPVLALADFGELGRVAPAHGDRGAFADGMRLVGIGDQHGTARCAGGQQHGGE
jgi:hypothetical protein